MGLTVAELDAKLTIDDRGFNQGLGKAEQGISGLRQKGEALSGMGDRWTRGVTLPIAAVGAAAVKTSIDFDTAMSRIVGLVGVASDEVDAMRGDVLALSGETTKSPQELADALFTITSAGLRGSEAMDVLEMSAKASAAGLGETRAIAEAVTATINTYGAEVIDAARATDILVGTAQAGNFATEDLAGSLGRVLPFAKAANVSFEDIGGTVALLTRQNNDANESITNTAALFRSFVKPSQQASDILSGVGLSAEKVRESMGERGLVATLRMLDGALGGNREQLGKIIEDSSGFAAAINILDADAEDLDSTFGTVENSAGLLDNAFAAFADSAGFTAKQAFANLQVALVRVGDIMVPIASDVLGFAADALSAFSELPDPVLQTAVALAGIAAAAGPVMSIGGRLLTMLDGLRKGFMLARTAMAAMGVAGTAAALGGLGLAVIAVTSAIDGMNRKKAEAKRITDTYIEALEAEADAQREAVTEIHLEELGDWVGTLREAGISLDVVRKAIEGNRKPLEDVNELWMTNSGSLQELQTAFQASADSGNVLAAELLKLLESGDTYGDATKSLIFDLLELNSRFGDARQQMEDTGAAEEELGVATDELTMAEENLSAAVDEVVQSMDELLARFFSVPEAMRAQQEALAALRESVAEHGVTLDIATEAGRRNQENLQALVESHAGLGEALLSTGASEEDLQGKMAVSRAALIEEARQAGFSKEAIRRLSDQIDGVDELVQTEFDAQVDPARGQVDDLKRKIDNVPRHVRTEWQINASMRNLDRAAATRGFHEGGIVPGPRGQELTGLLLAGEEVLSLDDPRHTDNLGRAMADADRSLAGHPATAQIAGLGRRDMGTSGTSKLTVRFTGAGALAEQVQHGVRTGQVQLEVDGKPVTVAGA